MFNAMRICFLFILWLTASTGAAFGDFDERHWELYAVIPLPAGEPLPPLVSLPLEPRIFWEKPAGTGYSDLRIVTGSRTEVPYALVTRNPEQSEQQVAARTINRSTSGADESYLEVALADPGVIYNKIEIVTDEQNFYRRVQVLGGADGRTWNKLREDAVIFDYTREERMRHVVITLGDATFPFIAVKILNGKEKPLTIEGLKVFYQHKNDPGIEVTLAATIQKQEHDRQREESVLIAALPSAMPVSRVVLDADDRNFLRRVIVFTRTKPADEWRHAAEATVFKYDTAQVKDSKLSIAIPQTIAKELKLIIRNFDSPPLKVAGITAISNRQDLIFKTTGRDRYFLFWGNPRAKDPHYDLSDLAARHDLRTIPQYQAGTPMKNPAFAGHEKQLPFTERYKYLLYGIVIMLMAGLSLFQYLVLRRTGKQL